ncbi:PspC domain-containing protein [Aliikangiella sp. IMCC44653]
MRHYNDHRYTTHECHCGNRAPAEKLMGVCAGISHQFGWDVSWVRIAAIISLLVFTVPTFIAYIVAGAFIY